MIFCRKISSAEITGPAHEQMGAVDVEEIRRAVATTMALLATREARYITGVAVNVNGGFSV